MVRLTVRLMMPRPYDCTIAHACAWMEYCYSGQPLLHLGKHTIHSCCGVQQGDPLGPLGFALTLHPLIEIIKSSLPSSLAMNAWYLDDGTLVGSPESLSAALGIIEKEGPKLGLHLNRRKSLLFIPKECDASSSPLPSDVPVAQGGFTLLGCPIGPPSYCEDILRARIDKIKQSLAALHELRDAQCETALLRSCLALPKLSYIIRTCPPCHISEGCKEFDSIIRDSLEMILGGPVSEWSLLKATLPSSRGGINLRSASLHAPAAFVASSISSQQLVGDILDDLTIHLHHLNSALSALASSTMKSDWEDLEAIDVPLHQRHLSAAIDEVNHQHLLSSAPTTRAHALANSTSLPHAGDWLNGVPSVSLGLHLHDREFSAASDIGWVCLCIVLLTHALNVTALLTCSGTIKLAVGETVTEYLVITPSVTYSLLQPNRGLSLHVGKLQVSSPIHYAAQPTSSSPTGTKDDLLL